MPRAIGLSPEIIDIPGLSEMTGGRGREENS